MCQYRLCTCLHAQEFVELVRGERMMEAIAYSRRHLSPWAPLYQARRARFFLLRPVLVPGAWHTKGVLQYRRQGSCPGRRSCRYVWRGVHS